MSSPEEHRLYPIILKQVLWDEDEAKIRKRLRVNEVPDKEAEAILLAARNARIYLLRSRAREQLTKGITAFLIGSAVLAGFYYRMGAFHIGVISGVAVFLLAGLAFILIGSLGHLNAPRQKGPISHED